MDWLKKVKDWWWLLGVVAGAVIVWGNLPERVKKVEAGQSSQQEELGAIRDETKEIQGYLKGQQALNERLAAQQSSPSPIPLSQSRTPASGHPRATAGHSGSETQELSDDGEVKEFHWTDAKGKRHHECCDAHDNCWPWRATTRCEP